MANVKRKKTVPRSKAPGRAPTTAATTGPSKVWKWIGGVVGAAAVAGLIWVIVSGVDTVPDDPPPGVRQVAPGDPRHIEGPIDYGTPVPAGGPHNPTPLACGFYEGVVPAEQVVHSLEHGAVWVTYRDLDDDGLDDLENLADDHFKVLVSEVPDQEPLVMATAWGFQLDLDSTTDDRLEQFVNAYMGASSAPEPGASC